MNNFDHIPPGKKVAYNPETGEHELVPLSNESVEDLKIMLEEEQAKSKDIEGQLEGLRKLCDSVGVKNIPELESFISDILDENSKLKSKKK